MKICRRYKWIVPYIINILVQNSILPMLPAVKKITFERLLKQSFNLQSDLYLLYQVYCSNIPIEYYFIQWFKQVFWDAKILRTRDIMMLFKLPIPQFVILFWSYISWSPNFILLLNSKITGPSLFVRLQKLVYIGDI